ncbi:MAG: hypothetical protein WC023_06300 [Rhodocyclaceae bacterium]
MTAFKTFTEDEKAALKLHGLDTNGPSQLSDCFVHGMRFAALSAPPAPAVRMLTEAEIIDVRKTQQGRYGSTSLQPYADSVAFGKAVLRAAFEVNGLPVPKEPT